MSVDESKIDLSKPYGALEGQTTDSQESTLGTDQPDQSTTPDPATSSDPAGDQQDTGDQQGNSTDGSSDHDNTVPYGRFKKFHDAAKIAQQEADQWRERYENALRSASVPQQQSQNDSDELPSYWVKLWGDNEVSREAWKAQQEMNKDLISRARSETLDEFNNIKSSEESRYMENLATLDENLNELSEYLGRGLTPSEEDAILDIIDEYTPKDRDGNYAGAILPIDKAWEIYDLKQKSSKAPGAKARDNVASLSSAGSQGDTSVSTSDDQFQPGDWGAWRRYLK